MDDSEVINFLLSTEIIPLCLRIMETGSELSKTVATFIVQKILLDDLGLSYICATYERYVNAIGVCNWTRLTSSFPQVLCRFDRSEQYGDAVVGAAIATSAQAYHPMLLATQRQCALA